MEEIWGSVTLPHIPSALPSVVQCRVVWRGEVMELSPEWEKRIDAEEALAMLLNNPRVNVGVDTLVPCFDADEMHRRSLEKRRT